MTETGDYGKLFLKLAQPNDSGESRVVTVKEFTGKNAPLLHTNGGSWCRKDGSVCKKFKMMVISTNGKIVYRFEPDDSTKYNTFQNILTKNLPNNIKKSNAIYAYILVGHNTSTSMSRHIPFEIVKKVTRNAQCVICGTTCSVECDHKNSLYNTIGKLSIDDFQPLCTHCNQVKRQVAKQEKNENKRFTVGDIPQFKSFPKTPWERFEPYNSNNPQCNVNTYYYDPILAISRTIAYIRLQCIFPAIRQEARKRLHHKVVVN